jgi:hypothetical protein
MKHNEPIHFCALRMGHSLDARTLSKWPGRDVTVGIVKPIPGLTRADQAGVIDDVAQRWGAVSGLRLRYVSNFRTAMVRMDSGRIDGPGGTLARSELPAPGVQFTRQLYDAGELRWSLALRPAVREIGAHHVVAHEIGHAVGIGHGPAGCLMAPIYDPAVYEPRDWDAREARARYGAPPALRDTAPPALPSAGLTGKLILTFDRGRLVAVRLPHGWAKGVEVR